MNEKQHEGDPGAPPAPIPASPAESRIAPLDARATREIGGPSGLEPTRYGDWERNGRCYDF